MSAVAQRPAPVLGQRFPDWPAHLNATIERARRTPFCWTRHNCASFAADCVAAMTGVHLHGQFEHMMTSSRRAVLHSADLDLWVDQVLGAERRVPLPFCGRGDVVLLRTPAGPALGICTGITAAAAGPDGIAFLPMSEALCAWRV